MNHLRRNPKVSIHLRIGLVAQVGRVRGRRNWLCLFPSCLSYHARTEVPLGKQKKKKMRLYQRFYL